MDDIATHQELNLIQELTNSDLALEKSERNFSPSRLGAAISFPKLQTLARF